MTTVASIEPTILAVPPGGEASCELTVDNRGDIVEGYRLEVLGDAAPWASVEPAMLSVYPGGRATARVAFRIPRSPAVPAAEVPFAVRVLPVERPDTAVVPEGVLRVGVYTDTTAELLPHTSKARRVARHDVAIDNGGNSPLRVDLSATDPDRSLVLKVRPAQLVVAPGRAAFGQVTVRHRGLRWKGQPASRPFQVTVAGDDGPPRILDGNSVQQPLLSRWIPKALALLLLLAVVAAGLWFGLLKPAIRSGADAEIKDKVVPNALAAPAGKGGGAKPPAAGGGASQAPDTNAAGAPAASGTAQPGGAPAAAQPARPGGELSSGRLDVDAAAGGGKGRAASDAVAANTTFWLTDISLGAPQGDTGQLDISVAGRPPFLTLSLATFRGPQDFHWVTPIQVPAGGQLAMNLTCTTAGPPLPGRQANRCWGWMSWSGLMQPART
jgi:hypothetical protein